MQHAPAAQPNTSHLLFIQISTPRPSSSLCSVRHMRAHMAGSRDSRPACAAPRRQRAPGPRMRARAPCTPRGRRAPRAGRRHSAAHRRSFTLGPRPMPGKKHIERENPLTSRSARKSDTRVVPLSGKWRGRSSARTRSGSRSRTGSSWAAAYGSSSAGSARPIERRRASERSRPEAQATHATPSASCRPPHDRFCPGFKLTGAIRSYKRNCLASFQAPPRQAPPADTHGILFACTRRAAVGRCGRRARTRRTRSSAHRDEPGACAIASSLASVESSPMAAGGATLQAPRHSSTSTACPAACTQAR